MSHSSDFYTEHPHARYVSVAAPREDLHLEHRMHALSIICPWIGGSSNAAAAEQALARILYKATMISSQPKKSLHPATARASSRPLVQPIFFLPFAPSVLADSADNTTFTKPSHGNTHYNPWSAQCVPTACSASLLQRRSPLRHHSCPHFPFPLVAVCPEVAALPLAPCHRRQVPLLLHQHHPTMAISS